LRVIYVRKNERRERKGFSNAVQSLFKVNSLIYGLPSLLEETGSDVLIHSLYLKLLSKAIHRTALIPLLPGKQYFGYKKEKKNQ
jgi:hypothetical protein